jgi:hypothetical protein
MKIHSVVEVVVCRQTAGRHGEATVTFFAVFHGKHTEKER